jgi:hypothetical protein
VGSLFGRPLQGRSLVAAPWGLLSRVQTYDENRPRFLSVTLDVGELREFRRLRKGRDCTQPWVDCHGDRGGSLNSRIL